jgi:DNA repair exonuclease SbcCD ATPase subunit
MRLLSLTLRNYRVHRELAVDFDPARNLIGGPNESGKSTLAEAAHRALFLRAKTGGGVQAEMVSTLHHGQPEVRLAFEAAGTRWEVEKRFAGAKGSARLSNAAGAVFKDDEAETKLSELLRSEVAGGRGAAGQLPALWAHLWVWQGRSGEDPGPHASQYKDTLVQRLQQDGVAAVMQSTTDQRVRERIASAYDALFTATGKPRAGSPPEQARLEAEAAAEAHRLATEALARLESAIDAHRTAELQIAEATAALPGLREQKTTAEHQLARVATLRQQEARELRGWQDAEAARRQLLAHDATIRDHQARASRAAEELQPAASRETDLAAAAAESRAASQTAEQALRAAEAAVRQTRLRHELASARVAAFEKDQAHRRLAHRASEAAALERERQDLLDPLARLPELSAKDLQSLRELDRDASQAAATLEAMAAGIELLDGDLPVTLDGQPLLPGQSHILTDAAELRIGDRAARLRIRPGGGTSLAEARARADRSRRALADSLARRALASLDQATTAFEQRQALAQQIAQLDARWKAMEGANLAAETQAAARDLASARAEVERRQHADEAAAPPASLEAALAARASGQLAFQQAEESEAAARRADSRLRTRAESDAAALTAHREQLASARQAARDLDTRIKVLEDTHGDAAHRSAAQLQAAAAEHDAADQLAATRQALAALAPDLLAADLDRFERAIARQETRRREAEDQRLTARARLHLDGSRDPSAELSHARARLDLALAARDSALARARAIEKLHLLFTTSREAIDRSLVQPLADRVAGYLQCLFGPAATVRITLSDQGSAALELLRPGDPAFHFATLSGGAREQVAAAVRLAMAEILAADHDGCLPVLFDDAFAFTDPTRIPPLQRMLDLAALRGLQVIVLSCSPQDYAAFGAKDLQLAALARPRPGLSPAPSTADPSASGPDTPPPRG